MSESVTYIRVNMNGKWTNLGIIAESEDLKEHFWFVHKLLEEKERADRYEKMWNELEGFLNECSMFVDERFQEINNASFSKEAIAYERILYKMHDLKQED